MERSNRIIGRIFAGSPLPSSNTQYHRLLALKLTSTGPVFLSSIEGSHSVGLRRVGYTYYDRGFANALFREALTHYGRYRSIRDAFVRRASEVNNPFWRMLPSGLDKWAALLEDLFSSPKVINDVKMMMQTCLAHDEFVHLTMDATIRCARRVKGQADYRASKERREAALFGDEVALRRVLSVRGRTGAVLGLWLLPTEDTDSICAGFRREFSIQMLNQCESLATDCPSGKLFEALADVMPHLKICHWIQFT